MKIMGANGIIQDVTPSVATGMIAAGLADEVEDETANGESLIDTLTGEHSSDLEAAAAGDEPSQDAGNEPGE